MLPSLVLLIALSWLYWRTAACPRSPQCSTAIKPAVVAIVLHAAWRIGSRVLQHPVLWLLAALAFVAIFALHVPFPAIVLGAGIAGALGGRFAPVRSRREGARRGGRSAREGGDRRRHRRPAACALSPETVARPRDRIRSAVGVHMAL